MLFIGEILAITELLPFGDLRHHLIKCRPSQHNLDTVYEQISPIGTKEMTRFAQDIAQVWILICLRNLGFSPLHVSLLQLIFFREWSIFLVLGLYIETLLAEMCCLTLITDVKCRILDFRGKLTNRTVYTSKGILK